MLRDTVAVAAIVALVAGCSFEIGTTSDGGTDDSPVIDGPPLPIVEFTQAAMTQDETSGALMIEVKLSAGATGEATVPFTFSGSATIDLDYKASPGTLTFALGETTKSIPVVIVADQVEEGIETILIALGAPTGAVLGTTTHAIEIAANTLARVNLATATSMVVENTAVTLTLALDKAASGPATVTYTVSGGTAQGSGTFADYTLASGVVSFPVGITTQPISLGVINDSRNELDETLTVALTSSTGVVIGTTAPVQTHTILNDDAIPSLSFTPTMSTVTEGDIGTAAVGLTVTLSTASGRTVTVPYSVDGAGTTATSPADYTLVGTSLVFDEGETSKDLTVSVVGDAVNEPTEVLTVLLGAPVGSSASLGSASRQLTITDNDPACVGVLPFRVCYNTAPAGAVVLPSSIDTTNNSLCESSQPLQWTGSQNQPTSCVIRGTSITGTGTTTVTGTRPLVLVASANISLDTLDVASRRGGTLGPGAATQPATCGVGAVGPSSGSSGGGGGGGFLTKGGNGGTGDNGAGGTAADAAAAPALLRAGCHGRQGDGGDETGKAGGVVYLAAGGTITITGGINASGSSAVGGADRSGGSGGGSGGMIMLHATAISAAGANVIANGAGGASGGDNDSSGRSGTDPVLTLPTTQAPGGAGGGTGGAGGSGWAGTSAATGGSPSNGNNEGGGGGGGGGGYIRSNVGITGATISAGAIQIIP